MNRVATRTAVGLLTVAMGVAVAGSASAAVALTGTIEVKTTNNVDSTADHLCSLVEAMKAVNGTGSYHECVTQSGTNHLTVKISSAGTISSSVEIRPNKDLIIKGTGLTATTINFTANTGSGCGVLGVSDVHLTLQDLTLQQSSGLTLTGVCGQNPTGVGPSIELLGVRVQKFQNSGVLMAAGAVYGTNVIIQNNHTYQNGGGIAILDTGVMETFTNLSLIGNFADGSGGGLWKSTYSNSQGNIYNGTISGNQAGNGGGIATGAINPYLEIYNTTIASNHAFNQGGGIWVDAGDCSGGTPVYINDSVVVSNTADYGAANFWTQCSRFTISTNTLWGGPFDQYTNLINSGAGDKKLSGATVGNEFSPLSNTGSPYFLPAYPPLSNSDARNMRVCSAGFSPDVRGVPRPQGPACDSGAWEVP